MLGGGVPLVAWGVIEGEWRGFQLEAVTWTSFLAFLYLIVFGSLIAFSAYSWLIRNTEPTLVATYAYVNPVVAVFLGWWIADEAVGVRTLIAAALIVSSVILVTTANGRSRTKPHEVVSSTTPRYDLEPKDPEQPGSLGSDLERPGLRSENTLEKKCA